MEYDAGTTKGIESGLRCIPFGASTDELRGACLYLPNGCQVVRKWKGKGGCTCYIHACLAVKLGLLFNSW